MAVRFSLERPLLRFADREYLASLYRGAFLVELWHLTFMPLLFLCAVAEELLPGGAVAGSIAGCWLLIGLAGWWWLTGPDPSGREESSWRSYVRVLLLVSAGSILTLVAAACANSISGAQWTETAALWAGWVLAVIWVVRYFVQLAYLRRLAERIPSDLLTKWSLRLMSVPPKILLGVSVLGFLAGSVAWQLAAVPLIVGMLAMLGCHIAYVALLDRVRARLRGAWYDAGAYRNATP